MTKTAEGSLIAYKAFDENFQCRGFQYEVGQTYTHDGPVEMCRAGFHACENPLDVLSYYPLIGSRFAVVEYDGEVERKDEGDSKVCGAKLTIRAEVEFGSLIEKAVSYIISKAKSATSGNYSHAATSGYSSHAATSGDRSPAATSGDRSHAATSGDRSHAATSGDLSHAATSGNRSPAATSGNSSHAATSGDYSPAATSGDRSHAEASGKNSVAASVGYFARAKAGETGGIALAEYDDAGNLVAMFASLVGQNGIEPDTFYQLKNGEPVKC